MRMIKEKRIGIFGGTFNPVHFGHLNVARFAVKRLKLDRLFFVPTYIPPHKKIEDNVSPQGRARMLMLAIKNEKAFSVSLFEVLKRQRSYSISTIRYFRKKFGRKAKLFFVIGEDSLDGLGAWKSVKSVLKLAQFAVFKRPGYGVVECPKEIVRIKAPGVKISSSKIRKLVRDGVSVEKYVPFEVLRYVKRKKFYADKKEKTRSK